MKKIFSLMTIAAGLLALAGCKEDLDSQSGSAAPYSGINFSMTSDSPNTRTQYSTKDWLQIEWVLGDKITLACDQTQAPISNDATNLDESNWAKKPSAIYKVDQVIADQHTVNLTGGGTTTIPTNSKARIKSSSTDAKDALYWGKNEVDHVFYAGYGEGITINEATGVATCVYQPDQFLTENARHEWMTNMEQAYMVATKTTKPVDNVDLHFKPIMTTLAVEVQAPAGGLTVKAMEIDLPASLDVIYTNNTTHSAYFDYDIANGTVNTSNVGTQTAEKLVFNLNTPKTLATGDKTTLVALLPPVTISSGDPITITIDANEGYSITTVTTLSVPAGNKAVISASADWKKKTIPEVEGTDYVDLGLGVMWATRNLGASSPEEYGDYYGYGCTVPYASSAYVDWSLYFKKIGGTGTAEADCGGTGDKLKNYFADFENISFTEWDVAHVKLGGNWRMPTALELSQLCNTTDFRWDWDGTRKGYIVTRLTGSCQGKSIFLPVGSGYRNGAGCEADADASCYYSSSPNAATAASYASFLMVFSDNRYIMYPTWRYRGMLVRPVYDPTPDAVDLGLSVKWAKCNLGANSPEQNGDHYGWGCITPYSADAVTWPLYFQKIGGTGTQESDCGTSADPLSGITDIGGNPLYDAARSKLGGNWRIPTYAWAKELLTLCDRSPVTNYQGTGINGIKIMNKTDKSVFLFLPLTGGRYLNSTSASNTDFGYFGVSDCAPASSGVSHRYDFYYYKLCDNCSILSGNIRPVGFPIRPVLAP